MDPFTKKPCKEKGEGRPTLSKPVNLPADVLDELKLVKSCYELHYSTEIDEWGNPIPLRLSYGQILSHWIDNLEMFDPEVADAFLRAKEAHKIPPETYPVDPTEGEVWDMKYQFINSYGDELEAIVDSCGTFVTEVNGVKVTAEDMLLNDWELINDAGIELTAGQARVVAGKILEHLKEKNNN